ncbi:FeoA family protein ['Nostoc azollae' 0708]|jgi:ferrous iron transport protein A|uniref:FeoA family protein n=1 Tax=Nostoc azollae (strain 0708) TaxID=551115 RepID=D7E3S9_NOSA0|nr:FeoA family protein ['Nostoc azollae' 0708]
MFTAFSIMGCSLELLKTCAQGIVTVCKTQDEIIRKKLISMRIKTGTQVLI